MRPEAGGERHETGKFRFSEPDHRYWLEYPTHTIELPSVTQIIDANGLISQFSKDEYAAMRGQLVHQAARYLFERRLDWSTVDKAILGYCASLDLWIKLTGFKAEACEVRRYHPILLFAGSYDVKGVMPNTSRWLIDLKSGVEDIWHPWQTGGYLLLEGGYRRRGSLYLQKDGRLAKFKEHPDYLDVTKFVSLLNTFRMKEMAK